MADDRDGMRAALAALALGRLTEAERVPLQAQVDGDPALARELGELRATAGLARQAAPDRVISAPVQPPEGLGERVLAGIARERAVSRRRRWMVTAASIAAAATVVLLVAELLTASEGGGRHRFATAPAGVEASYALAPGHGGTRIELTVDGLDNGHTYR